MNRHATNPKKKKKDELLYASGSLGKIGYRKIKLKVSESR